MRKITAAIVSTPHSGKTTLFNAITGSGRHDGDHCGAGIAGMVEQNGIQVQFINLPGTHTLMATTWREILTCNFLRLERPDVVVHVVDASHLVSSLYLLTLLMELGLRLVVALNMLDVAEGDGIFFDTDTLSRRLKLPVVPTTTSRPRDIDGLLPAVVAAMDSEPPGHFGAFPYPDDFIRSVDSIDAALAEVDRELANIYPSKWMALKLLENDADLIRCVKERSLLEKVRECREEFQKCTGSPFEMCSAMTKLDWAAGLADEVIRRNGNAGAEETQRLRNAT